MNGYHIIRGKENQIRKRNPPDENMLISLHLHTHSELRERIQAMGKCRVQTTCSKQSPFPFGM